MKKLSILLTLLFAATLLASCSRVNIKGTSVNLKYISPDEIQYDIHLEDSEAEKIKGIFDGKPTYREVPSCGFSDECGFNIGGKMYAISLDGCGIVKDCSSGVYFNLSEAEAEYIKSIFENYEIDFKEKI